MRQSSKTGPFLFIALTIPIATFAREAGRFGVVGPIDERAYVPAGGLGYIFVLSWLPLVLFIVWMSFHSAVTSAWPQVKYIIIKSFRYGWLTLLITNILTLAIPYIVAKVVCPPGYDFFAKKTCGWYVDYAEDPWVRIGSIAPYVLMIAHWAAILALAIVTLSQMRGRKAFILVFISLLFSVSIIIFLLSQTSYNI